MTRLAAPLPGDPDAAEDVVQRAFVKAFSTARSKPDVIEKIRKPSAWLLRITRNRASGVLKTEARRRRRGRENGDEVRENLFPQPDEVGEWDLRIDWVLEATPSVLTKRQLQVVRLTLDGMNDREVAQELGIESVTARWHRRETIAKLRSKLG